MKTHVESNSLNDESYVTSDNGEAVQADQVSQVAEDGDIQEQKWTLISKVALVGMFGFIALWIVVIAAVTFYVTVMQPLSPAVATYPAR